MKKKIQRYLAGERQGFSLVELIIVIAIMVILVGVIALAVIPNIQRSRESKDISFLDSVATATKIVLSNRKLDNNFVTLYTFGTDGVCNPGVPHATAREIAKAIWQNLPEHPTLSSSAATDGGGSIMLDWDYTGTFSVKIWGKDGKTKSTKYLSEPSRFFIWS